jgi:uncharacterized protein (TIGR02145 family)
MSAVVLACTVFASASALSAPQPAPQSKRMPDGKQWMTENLAVPAEPSYCYDNAAQQCAKYGRLYTWASAQQGCRSLGSGWRLPTNEEWYALAKHYGGLREETADLGKAAYMALMTGGASGFNAVLGGGRTDKSGEYQRGDAHGLYWTASETGPDTAWMYNFGKGGQSLNRHKDAEKLRAVSVRCVRA